MDRVRADGPARDGESDVVIVHPEHGILAIEVKGGPVRRDGFGRGYTGTRDLKESPFAQVETGKWAIARKIEADPRASGRAPRMLHAVAFPDVDRATIGGGKALGPDAPGELILDRADLADATTTADALDRIFAFWSGDGARDRTMSDQQLQIIDEVLEPDVALRALLRGNIEEGERELLAPTHHQLTILKTLRHVRRASIEGGAGSGKTLLAAEKARQLATEGFDVLLVCFNQPLARALAQQPELAPLIEVGRLTVSTFHELCRRLGAEAGVLPVQPAKPDTDWFGVTLPNALEQAIPDVGGRWQAVIVDLVELRPDDERLGKLLYIGATRAKHHLVAIATPEVSKLIGPR